MYSDTPASAPLSAIQHIRHNLCSSVHSTSLHSFISFSSLCISLLLLLSQQTFSNSLSCKLGCLSSLISKHVCLLPCLLYLPIQPTLGSNGPARCESRIKAATHVSELNRIIWHPLLSSFLPAFSGAALIACSHLWESKCLEGSGEVRNSKKKRASCCSICRAVAESITGVETYRWLQSICVSVFPSRWRRLGNWLAASIPEVSRSQIGIHTSGAAAAHCFSPAPSRSLHRLHQTPSLLRGRKTASSSRKKRKNVKMVKAEAIFILFRMTEMTDIYVVPIKYVRTLFGSCVRVFFCL